MMTIEEFREQFINDLRSDAEYEGTDTESQFITNALDDLEELGELNDAVRLSVDKNSRRYGRMAFDAYAYDQADGAFVLITSNFINERGDVGRLTNSNINDITKNMRNFVCACIDGDLRECFDASSPVLDLAKDLRTRFGQGMQESELMRFKFYILSNKELSTQVKSVAQEPLLDRPVELNVWTLERFYQSYASETSELIELETADFGCEGIPCLKAELGEEAEYDAYLGIMPGRFLADIYLKYGSKLLQGNVRAFLTARGKVNKGIRTTIIKEPANFFTYNNGIALVARQVTFSPDGRRITHFKDPQIINGGQTTASLANAIIKKEDRNGMDALFVPMKLTVLRGVGEDMTDEQEARYNKMTKTISQCANSQNPVSEADFFSNHPFHIVMENLSRTVLAPPTDDKPYQTMWFYERSRGKWEQEQMKLTQAQRNRYREQHPKKQVIKKEKLAKCLNTVYMRPDQVCKSSALNFSQFAGVIEKIYEEHRERINDVFFKRAVCAVILFDTLDAHIAKAAWYPQGGNKAQITPYTIAKLISLLPKGLDIDWHLIWQKQTLYPELLDELMRLAYCTHLFLMDEAKGGLVRTIARTERVWKAYQVYQYELSQTFVSSLIPIERTQAEAQAAARDHRFNANIDHSVEIYKLGTAYWLRVHEDLSKDRIVSPSDLELIQSVAIRYIGRGMLPPAQKCKRLVKVITKAEERGYVMP